MKADYLYKDWLINKYGGTTIKESIFNAVDKLIIKSEQSELPIKLSNIAKLIGISPFPLYRDQIPYGQLIEINNEFRISLKMKSGKPPSVYWYGYPKLRFSYAHELIHCLHYDFSSKPPKRTAPKSNRNTEEVLCNYGATILLLPQKLVMEYIKSLKSNDVICIATSLVKKAHVSLQSSIIYLLENDFLSQSKNTWYIFSAKHHEGYRIRKDSKARCIASILYLDDHKKDNFFLPGGKGIDSIGSSWSLINFHSRSNLISELSVENEIINVDGKKYILNGKHKRIENSSYVWSDLKIELI